jgi:hypothetical protein
MSSMVPPEVLAKLPPEQRAKMEAAMQGRGGTRTTTKHCVTKETVNEALASANTNSARQNCTRTFVTSTGTKQVIHMECTSGNMKTSGDIQVEVIDRENTKGSMVMNSAGGRGGMKMEWTTKWLGADCGDVGQKKN